VRLQKGKQRPLNMLEWMRERVDGIVNSGGSVEDDLLSILKGPSSIAGSYNHFQDSGRHFRVHSMDKKRMSSSDLGLFSMSLETDPTTGVETRARMPFCGILKEILEVNFGTFEVVLFGASWYRFVAKEKHEIVVMDDCGFWRVNTDFKNPRNMVGSDN